MSVLRKCSQISSEFANWVEVIAEKRFSFREEYPMLQSAYNHEHLWLMESLADDYKQINLGFRCEVVNYIFERWQANLKGYEPYQKNGFILYLYEDMAPTVSVIANTKYGFPYIGSPIFVDKPEDVLEFYTHQSWKSIWKPNPLNPNPDKLLEVLEQQKGSLNTTAKVFGLKLAALRRYIEWHNLSKEVNLIRKKYHRRPAVFKSENEQPFTYKIWEKKLEKGY